jgi:hypothetical protein
VCSRISRVIYREAALAPCGVWDSLASVACPRYMRVYILYVRRHYPSKSNFLPSRRSVRPRIARYTQAYSGPKAEKPREQLLPRPLGQLPNLTALDANPSLRVAWP